MNNYLQEKLKVRKPFLYLLFFVLIIALYNYYVVKEISYIKEVKAEINILEEQLSLLDENNGNIIPPVSMKENLYLELSSPLLIELNEYAQEVKLDIIAFQQKEKIINKDLEENIYQLVLQCDYAQFLQWLKLLEKSPFVISLDRFMEKKILIRKENINVEPDEVNVFLISLKTFELKNGIGKGI